MKYGIADKLTTLLICADSFKEYDEFVTLSFATLPAGAFKVENPDPIEIFTENKYDGFKNVVIYFHRSEADREEFCRENDVKILTDRDRVLDEQEIMLNDKARLAELDDDRTAEQILGLDKHDPWDKRTDEQKKAAEEHRKKYDEAKKQGRLSGDSFSPRKDNKIGTMQGTIKVEEDGSVTVNLPAHKITEAKEEAQIDDLNLPAADFGIPSSVFTKLEDEDHYIVFKAKTPIALPMDDLVFRAFNLRENEQYRVLDVSDRLNLVFQMPSGVAGKVLSFVRDDYDAYVIDGKDTVIRVVEPVTFGMGVETPSNKHWRTVLGHINTNDLIVLFEHQKSLFTSGFDPVAGWWVGSMRKRTIEDVIETHSGTSPELVDKNGDVLAADAAGFVIVDQNAVEEIGPRPWNDRSAEWFAMSDDERTEERKKITGNEFLFCGEYHGSAVGTIIYVTPKEYFLKNERMWDEALNIGHIMPNQYREKSPGVYTSEAFDHWDQAARAMAGQKFNYDLLMQVYINNR